MCIIGNPPYSVSSANTGEWINHLMMDYKRDLKERNIQPLSDDYIKFIRFAQHLIEKTGEGIIGVITNNSFLDGLIHRQMRKSMLETFDKIYIIDLHGSTKKKEVTPDGKPDKNVFDIQQGVGITIALKKKGSRSVLAEVHHIDMWGERKAKHAELEKLMLSEMQFKKISPEKPNYFFIPKDFEQQKKYEEGFKVDNFMPINSSGIKTHRDNFVIDIDKLSLENRLKRFFDKSAADEIIRAEMKLKDNRDWSLSDSRKSNSFNAEKVTLCSYRPFDSRFIYYDSCVIDFDRMRVMHNLLKNKENFGLQLCRQFRGKAYQHCLVHNFVSDMCYVSLNTSETGYTMPLYLYPTDQDIDQTRRVNFDPALYAKLQTLATHPDHGTPDELNVFDYLYGVLHSPAYRQTYAEFLKIDFPRIPWPTSPQQFWDIAAKGNQLRQLHLMEPAAIGPTPYPFTGDGDNIINTPRYTDGKIYINAQQYFDNAPEIAWNFYIGGYQPAQKWLKDRKGRTLNFEEVKHYQRIIKVLSETQRIMHTLHMDL